MQISLSDEVPSAGDVDRNGVEFEAEPDTSKPDGVSNDIDKNEQLLPLPSIITSFGEENVSKK